MNTERSLYDILHAHRGDHDGGYELSWDLADLLRQTTGIQKDALRTALVELVHHQSANWGAACSALVDAGESGVRGLMLELLDRELHARSVNNATARFLVELLIKLSSIDTIQVPTVCVDYIRDHLTRGNGDALVLLSRLAPVDSVLFTRMAMTFMPRYFGCCDESAVPNVLGAFAYDLMRCPPAVITKLTQTLESISKPAARRFVSMLRTKLLNIAQIDQESAVNAQKLVAVLDDET